MSTVTRLLSCYESSLSDLEPSPPAVVSIGEIMARSEEASQRLVRVGLGASHPEDRLDRKARLQIDVTAEREALATRA